MFWLGKKGPFTDSVVRQMLERRCTDAGIEAIHPHQFRHTMAHDWLAAGGHEHDLMRLAGWRSRQMVGRYAAHRVRDHDRTAPGPAAPGTTLRARRSHLDRLLRAGHTSLSQLKTLPVSELKIDRSFVMGMGHDDSDALIVRSVVDLCHNLGMTIVAEGVENVAAWESLASFGCDVARGYHILRPGPAATIDRWWLEQRLTSAASPDALPTHKNPNITDG